MDMETCAGCGTTLAPTWKFCVRCGLAVPEVQVPGAIRPDAPVYASHRTRNRALLIGGIGIFLIGIALLVVAFVMFTSSSH